MSHIMENQMNQIQPGQPMPQPGQPMFQGQQINHMPPQQFQPQGQPMMQQGFQQPMQNGQQFQPNGQEFQQMPQGQFPGQQMQQGSHPFDPVGLLGDPNFGVELIYTLVVIASCFFIYRSTKEMYELTGHRGIKYFRNAFLFFGIAYFVRFFIRLFVIALDLPRTLRVHPSVFGQLNLFLFVFASTMAILYLLCSTIWKKFPEKGEFILYIVAFIVAAINMFEVNQLVTIAIQLILLISTLVVSYFKIFGTEKEKKGNAIQLYVIYLLLFVFWTLNMLDILVPDFLRVVQLLIYAVSTLVFLVILYKVIKRVGTT